MKALFILLLFFSSQAFSEEMRVVPPGGETTLFSSYGLGDLFGVTTALHGKSVAFLSEGMQYFVVDELYQEDGLSITKVRVVLGGIEKEGLIINGPKRCIVNPNYEVTPRQCDDAIDRENNRPLSG